MPQFLITALGSYGDVHPMVGLGARAGGARASREDHHESVFRGRRHGRRAGAGAARHARGVHPAFAASGFVASAPRAEAGAVARIGAHAAAAVRSADGQLRAGRDGVLCACAWIWRAAWPARNSAAPVASVIFAPGMLWSLHDSPRLKGALLGPRVPQWLKRLQFWVSDTVVRAAAAGAAAQRLATRARPAAGAKRYFQSLVVRNRPDARTVSRLVRPAAARLAGEHAAGRLSAVGFARRRADLSRDVHEFLAAGTPPIAFSPGSANREAHQFFAAAVDACQRLGRRGILLTKYDHQLPANLPDSVRHFGFVPMSKLLPHTAALVHHGGIGSCAPRAGGRRAAHRAADVVRPVRQFAAAGATGRGEGNLGADSSRGPSDCRGAASDCSIRQLSRPTAASWRPAATARRRSPPHAMRWSNWPQRTSAR